MIQMNGVFTFVPGARGGWSIEPSQPPSAK